MNIIHTEHTNKKSYKKLHPTAKYFIYSYAIAFCSIFFVCLYAISMILYIPYIMERFDTPLKMVAFYMGDTSLSIMVSATVAPDIVLRVPKRRVKALYLRKFNSDDMEHQLFFSRRKVKFRFASLADNIGMIGISLFVMRDSLIPGARHTLLYWFPVIAPLIVVTTPAVYVFLYIFLLAFIADAATSANIVSSRSGSIMGWLSCIAALLISVSVRRIRRSFIHSFAKRIVWVRIIISRGINIAGHDNLSALLETKKSVGAISVKCHDHSWIRYISYLINNVDVIFADLRNSSDSCKSEVAIIRLLDRSNSTIWLTDDSSEDAIIRADDDNYTVFDVKFSGKPAVYKLPSSSQFDSFLNPVDIMSLARISRMFSDILYIIDDLSRLDPSD